ncbi:hypothetical protein BGZ80_008370 [Entomortierella chlamydospora]|uniref:Uncharacterized protein n=1 Tax=Entomortierella chlamydospora TaxID=101097 RepID=A0A9P6T1N3_9FUNG|nr:hypothetical protein BGZ79_005406 [Entomortierella chlamydospora]KAG0017350.1 hypothetical protein BGZ80_008370 [Entomortierella chlamydospora]
MANPALPAQRFHSSAEDRTTSIDTLVHPSTSGPFILWEHIQNSFRRVSLVRAGDTDVQFMVGDDLKPLKPLRIRYYPDTMLEVIQAPPSSYTNSNRARQTHEGTDSIEARLSRIVRRKRGKLERGRVTVYLSSSSDTLDLYPVLAEAAGVYRLTITLAWDVGRADLQQLCDTVRMSKIQILTLNGSHFKDPRLIPDIPDSRFDPIVKFLATGKLKSFSFRDCPQFLEFTTGLGQRYSSRLVRLYWEHVARERESEVVRGNIVNLCRWFPNLIELSLGCYDIEDMYTLLEEPIRNLPQLSLLTLTKARGQYWGKADKADKAVFWFNDKEIAYLDLELLELPKLSSELWLTSGFLRRLTWYTGSYYPDIVQDIHDRNKKLGTLTVPFYFSEREEFSLFKRIEHLESLVLNRYEPLQVTFADRYDHCQTFQAEFRNPNKDFPDPPAEWQIQDPEPIMRIQGWKLEQYNLYVSDDLATLLAAAGEQLSFGEPDLQIGFKPINDLVKLSTVGARLMQTVLLNMKPKVMQFSCDHLDTSIREAFCSGLNSSCWSRLSDLEIRGEDINSWIGCPAPIFTRELMPALSYIQVCVYGKCTLSSDSVQWITSMISSNEHAAVPLENFAIRGVDLEESAWTEIINAINFTELQGLFFGACNLKEAHFEQLVERLPEEAKLRWLRFYSTDWSPVNDDEIKALKARLSQKMDPDGWINFY